MEALILETSTQKNFLLLAENGAVRKSALLPEGPDLSKRLALEVKNLLQGRRVDFIFAGQGPGSYTGTRVGVALAKGLSFGWKIPLYGFCSLKAFTPSAQGPFAILLDARMGGTYVLRGERKGEEVRYDACSLVKIEALPSLLQSTACIVSPSPALLPYYPSVQEAFLQLEELAFQAFCPAFQTPLQLTYSCI